MMSKCFLCEEGKSMQTDDDFEIYLANGDILKINYEQEYYTEIVIHYCPICGRKLEQDRDKGYTIV